MVTQCIIHTVKEQESGQGSGTHSPADTQNDLQSGSFICAHQDLGKFRAKSIKKHVLPLQPGQK